jgi:transcriptional regulator with XRE-family HTH domain
MNRVKKTKSLLDQELQNEAFKKAFEEIEESLRLEIQMLNALETKGITYSQLADKLNTSKSNISRDLRGGGLFTASVSRVARMAEALGMKLVALLIPKEREKVLLPKIQELIRSSMISSIPKVEYFGMPSFASMQGATLTGESGFIVLRDHGNPTFYESQPAKRAGPKSSISVDTGAQL